MAEAVDLDMRLLHGFTVVADLLHFGRAAEALHTTQPSLSRQIRRLEQQAGAVLLDRSPRGVALTPAGRVLLPEAKRLLESTSRVLATVRAATVPNRLVIGYSTNIRITPAAIGVRERYPDADIQTMHLAWDQPGAALRNHLVDVAVVRAPIRSEGLTVVELYEESRALLVSRGHRLADRLSVSLDDVAGEPIPRVPDDTWNAFWRVDPRPDGTPAPDGPTAATVEDKLELVASGQAVAIVPAGEFLDRVRPDLVAIPLTGVDPGHVVAATRQGEQSPMARSAIRLARKIEPGSS